MGFLFSVPGRSTMLPELQTLFSRFRIPHLEPILGGGEGAVSARRSFQRIEQTWSATLKEHAEFLADARSSR